MSFAPAASASLMASNSASTSLLLPYVSRISDVCVHVFHLYVSCVSSGCCKRIWCCICYNGYTRMFQVYVPHVSAVSDVCCKCVFQMFQAHVSCVSSGCCNDYTSMFQEYTAYVAIVGRMLQR
jgi:hypothetical protein